jgi:hypothetical protein
MQAGLDRGMCEFRQPAREEQHEEREHRQHRPTALQMHYLAGPNGPSHMRR